jgi:hypothetical protein
MFAPATYRDRRRTLREARAGAGEGGLPLFLRNDESPCNGETLHDHFHGNVRVLGK